MLKAIFSDFETYELILVLLLAILAPRTKDTALVLLALNTVTNSFDLGGSLLFFPSFCSTADLISLSTNFVFLLVSLMSFNELLLHSSNSVEQVLLVYFIDGFVEIVLTTTNLFEGFIGIMGFSLALYVILTDEVDSNLAREAAIKYFYLSALSSALVAMGVFVIIFVTLESDLYLIDLNLMNLYTKKNNFGLIIFGVFFLLFGLFFKLSAFPGHLWAPEIYEGSSGIIMTLFMTVIKIAVFVFLSKILLIGLPTVQHFWLPLVNFSALGSLLWGCFAALEEKRLRRFFAYTSINQMGFLLLGLSCGTDHAVDLAIFYFVIYLFSTAGLNYVFFDSYLVWGNPANSLSIRPITFLSDLTGLAQKVTYLTPLWMLTLVLFSMIGVPPLAGFFAKYLLLLQVFEQGNALLLFVALLTSLISAYYYLRLIKTIWFEQPIFPTKTTILFLPDFLLGKNMPNEGVFLLLIALLWLLPFCIFKIF